MILSLRTVGLLALSLLVCPGAQASGDDTVLTGLASKGPTPQGLEAIKGPLPGQKGWTSPEKLTQVSLPLSQPTALPAGSLSVWFYLPESLRSGPESPKWKRTLLSAPGIFELSLACSPPAAALYWNWQGESKDAGYFPCILPGLPGPGWHQVTVVWDSARGYFNLYLDGAPASNQPSGKTPWSMRPLTSLKAHVEDIGLMDVKLVIRVLGPADIEGELNKLYQVRSDVLMGVRPLGPLSLDESQLEPIYSDPLTAPPQGADWKMEGVGRISYGPQGLEMWSERPDGPEGHFVYWLDKKLPEDFVARWEVEILSAEGLNIVFFSATGPGGGSIFDPTAAKRDGIFRNYHSGDIDCYHISYFANTPVDRGRATSNLRKNKGFYLVANGCAAIPPGPVPAHTVTLVKRAGRIQLGVDGQLIIDWLDDGHTYGPVLGAGWFGLRQMQWTRARYRNLTISHWK